jgi:hypothetical protein
VASPGSQQVAVTTELTGGPSCTVDHVPATSTIDLPSGVSATQTVKVTVDGLAISLPALAA